MTEKNKYCLVCEFYSEDGSCSWYNVFCNKEDFTPSLFWSVYRVMSWMGELNKIDGETQEKILNFADKNMTDKDKYCLVCSNFAEDGHCMKGWHNTFCDKEDFKPSLYWSVWRIVAWMDEQNKLDKETQKQILSFVEENYGR